MKNVEPVLIICNEGVSKARITATIQKCGLRQVQCSNVDDARSLLAGQMFSIVFCADILPDGDFRTVIAAAESIPVIVLSRLAEWDAYIVALEAGAFDYIACPPDIAETERILTSALYETLRIRQTQQMAA